MVIVERERTSPVAWIVLLIVIVLLLLGFIWLWSTGAIFGGSADEDVNIEQEQTAPGDGGDDGDTNIIVPEDEGGGGDGGGEDTSPTS